MTATRLPTESFDVPANVTVIEGLDVDVYDNFLIQSLSHVTGVRIDDRPSDSLFGGFELRGFGTNDTSGSNALILLDGIPQRRLSFGGPYLGMLPFDAVQRQELVRGSLSSLYGRGAIAGALQLFTDPGTTEWRIRGNALVKSTNDTLRGAVRLSGPLGLGDGGTFSLTASGKYTDGWQPRTASEKQDAYFHGRIPLGDADVLTVVFGHARGEEDVPSPIPVDAAGNRPPGITRDTNLAIPGHNFFDLDETRAAVTWQHHFAPTTRFEASLSYWQGDTVLFLGRPTSGAPAGSTVLDRLTSQRFWQEESFYGSVQLQHEERLSSTMTAALTVGVSTEYLTWDNRTRNARLDTTTFGRGIPIDYANPVEPDPSTWIFQPFSTRFTDEDHFGGFVRGQLDVGDFVFDLGARYDTYERFQQNRSNGNSSEVDEWAISPAAGALWRLIADEETRISPYANWSRGFNPVFRAVGTTEIADVDPETSESFELGVKADAFAGLLEGSLAAYQIDREDVVAFDAASNNFVNSGLWRVRGVELGVVLRPTADIEIYANYTWREPTIEVDPSQPATEGNDVPLVPREIAKLGVRYRPTRELLFDLDTQYIGRSFGSTTNVTRLPDHLLVDLSATWRVSENWSASVFGTNLLDEEYFPSAFASPEGGAAFAGLPLTVGASFGFEF